MKLDKETQHPLGPGCKEQDDWEEYAMCLRCWQVRQAAPDYDSFARDAVQGMDVLLKIIASLHDSPKSLQAWLESEALNIKATADKGRAAIAKASGEVA